MLTMTQINKAWGGGGDLSAASVTQHDVACLGFPGSRSALRRGRGSTGQVLFVTLAASATAVATARL